MIDLDHKIEKKTKTELIKNYLEIQYDQFSILANIGFWVVLRNRLFLVNNIDSKNNPEKIKSFIKKGKADVSKKQRTQIQIGFL